MEPFSIKEENNNNNDDNDEVLPEWNTCKTRMRRQQSS